MIQLGKPTVSIFPNNGIIWDNKGCISFLGNAHIGNNSSISTGNTGMIEFGNNFRATTTVRIISYDKITFGKNCLIGWDCLFTDTDFHFITKRDGSKTKALNELEQCGFIRKYKSYTKENSKFNFQLIDPFMNFCFKFIKNREHESWMSYINTPAFFAIS